ncbi:MAG TPA: lactate dehydrogenase, partial [Aquificaceae bacterium]|nr:lactate dehydrogenase [Aquificaceae bacterium]
MKIVFTSLKEFEKDFYRERLSDHEVSLYTEPINRVSAEELERADILSVFVTDRLGKELLSRLPKLKLLITRSVGTDHIDVDFCRERGIRVANVPAYSPRSIAEHAIALMLSLTRKLKRVER